MRPFNFARPKPTHENSVQIQSEFSPKEILFFRANLVLCITTILYLATTPLNFFFIQTIGDKFQHLFAFIVLAILLDYSFPKQGFNTTKVLTLLGFGLLIELVQHPLPHRFFSLHDIMADTLGVMLYFPLQLLLKKLPFLKRRFIDSRQA